MLGFQHVTPRRSGRTIAITTALACIVLATATAQERDGPGDADGTEPGELEPPTGPADDGTDDELAPPADEDDLYDDLSPPDDESDLYDNLTPLTPPIDDDPEPYEDLTPPGADDTDPYDGLAPPTEDTGLDGVDTDGDDTAPDDTAPEETGPDADDTDTFDDTDARADDALLERTITAAEPQIAQTNPPAGAEEVSILVNPSIVFVTEPAEVGPDTLTLATADGVVVAGTVEHDPGTATVQFVPDRPLAYGERYVLTTPAGAVVFTTAVNPPDVGVGYVGENVDAYQDVDVDGDVTERRVVGGPGNDGEWFTDDDPVASLEVTAADPGDEAVRQLRYAGPGDDGQWRTEDDLVASYTEWRTAEGRTARFEYTGPGADGQWFTGDDAVGAYLTERATDAGTTLDLYAEPGGDGEWLTDDDVLSERVVTAATPDGGTAWLRYLGPGSDGDWGTDDDFLATHVEIRPGAGENDELTIIRADAGADGDWRTDDDVISLVLDEEYDASGGLQRRVAYGGPGVDGQWLTDDDEPVEYTVFGYDERQLGTGVARFIHPGPDAEWFTADDVAGSAAEVSYDQLGNRTWLESQDGAQRHDLWWFSTGALRSPAQMPSLPGA